MNDAPLVPKTEMAEKREHVVQLLCDHFAAGHIELDELERRLAASDEAGDVPALNDLVHDLPRLAEAPARQLATAKPAKLGWALACLGGSTRKGQWTPAQHTNAIAVMGGIELDFRGARLGPGLTRVVAIAVMGGIDIKVPPDLPVEVRGLGVLGAVDQVEQESGPHHPQAPRLEITAIACMGGVEVKTLAKDRNK